MLTIALVAALFPPAVPQEQYVKLCAAIVAVDKATLETMLSRNFESIETSGHVEGRAAFIADLEDPGPVTIKRCSYRVLSRETNGDGERDRTIWTIEGTAKSGTAVQPFTAIAQNEQRWTRESGSWRLRRQQTFILKQWSAGQPMATQTFSPPLSPAQRAAVVADLRVYAHPLRSAYPGGTDADLAPVLRAAGSARVIAMGEASHGTGEFFALKDRVFRYAVEHGGVTVFAQETNWSDGENIEQYLQAGKGNLPDLLAATFAVWNNSETLELLQWMRAYNVAHPHALHFFGIDMQSPKVAAESVIAFYKTYDAANAARVAAAESCITVRFMTLYDSPADAAKCIAPTRTVLTMLAGNEARFEKAAGRAAYLNVYHAADVAAQAASMLAEQGIVKQANSRDAAMAHNVEWMLSALYPSARVFLWAHNGHVGVDSETQVSMGTHLRAALHSNYFTIGQTFDHGELSLQRNPPAYVGPAQGNGSEVVLRQAGLSPFFLNFADVPAGSALGRWLAKPHGIREIGAVWKASEDIARAEWEVALPHAYDAITFVNDAHAAHSFDLGVERDVVLPPGASGWLSSVPWTFRSTVGDDANGGAQLIANGRPALYLVADPKEAHFAAWLETRVDAAAYRGKLIRLRGLLATTGVTTGTSLSVGAYAKEPGKPLTPVVRGPASALAGTNSWRAVDISFAVPKDAQTIDIQFLLNGGGSAWLSDLSLSDEVSAK